MPQVEDSTQAGAAEQRVIIAHSYLPGPDRLRVKLEKNTKGFNWEVSYSGESLEEVLSTLREARVRLEREYGDGA